jgi:hypothetical protein
MIEKPNLRMKCILSSEDNGKTWTVSRIDYLTSAKTPYSKFDYEDSSQFQGTCLKA